MRRISLLFCSMIMCISAFSQNLTIDIPVTISSGDRGQALYSTNDLTVITSDANQLYETLIDNDAGNYSLTNTNAFFTGSSEFSIFHGNTSPTFYKTGAAGNTPNRNVTLENRNEDGTLNFNETYATQADDFGLKTIGTTDGALTIAARKSPNDSLFQLVAIKTNSTGTITWETVIPLANTGYDDIFQGVDSNGDFIEQITVIPPVSIVEATNDGGYVIVNPNKKYFPPGTTTQHTNIIKLSGAGDLLWSNNVLIPWRELEIGPNPSLANNRFRGLVSSVEGINDGSVYVTFSSSNDINPNAQFRKLDAISGAIIQSFSTSWSLNGNVSFLIKELEDRVYWLKISQLFEGSGPPTLSNDFAIFDITNGISNVEAVNSPIAKLPETPGATFVPFDVSLTDEGNFLVVGTEYINSVAIDDLFLTTTPRQPFVVLLENNDNTDSGVDLELEMTTQNQNVGIYETITLDITITNTGNTDANTASVSVKGIQGDVVFAGETPPVASQGLVSTSGVVGDWNVGTLMAGETATLNITYFTLAANSSFCAQVSEQLPQESDSSPNNNLFCEEALEDDEAILTIGQQSGTIQGTVFIDDERNGGQNCSSGQPCTFVSGIQLDLYIQGTNTLVGSAITQTDGTYVFQNVPPGIYNLEYEYQNDLVVTPYFNGPFGFEFRNNFVDNGFETPYIGVSINNNSTNVVRNLGLVDGTECTLDELFAEIICNDNGTPNNPNDDTFQVNFRADGQGRAAFSLNGSNGALWNNSITYSDGFELIGPFDVSELPVTLTLNNLGNLPGVACSLSENITSVNCGGTGSNLPDLTFDIDGLDLPLQGMVGQQNIFIEDLKVKNIGTSATPSGLYQVQTFLSNDIIYSANDPLIGTVQFQPFAVGQEYNISFLDLPETITPGTYYLFYFVDGSNDLAESDETNNVVTFPIEISEGDDICNIFFGSTGTGLSPCQDNGTPNDPSDDFYQISLTPSSVFSSGNFNIEIPTINANGTVTYNTETHPYEEQILLNYNIQAAKSAFPSNSIEFSLVDSEDANCTELITFSIPDICSLTGNGGVDLELSASEDVPSIYQNGQAVFTLINTGSEDATGILVEFTKNSTLNITSTPAVSQGTPQEHWTDTPRWNVGSLAAGQSATITFDIFTLSDDVNFYGEVIAQNENDADSTPNNGNGTTASEDDEAVYPDDGGNTGGGNQADLTLANLNIMGQSAPGEVTDYTVSVSNIGTATAVGNYIIGAYLSTDNQLSTNDIEVGLINTGNTPVGTEPLTTGAITIPDNQMPGDYFLILEIDTNDDITESNENNNITSTPISIAVVDGCSLSIEIGTVSCSTAGTPNDTSDDTYGFTFTVVGQNASNDALINSNADLPTNVNLGQSYTVTGIAASEPPVSITALDPVDNSCQSTATVNPPGTCGQGTGSDNGVDLVANIITATTSVGQYENVSLNYNIINTGTETATNVTVVVPKPEGVVYVGGNEFEVSQGDFDLFNTGVWTIGTIEPGTNLTLTVNYFTLSAGEISAWLEVASINEEDVDSTPGNGTPFVSSMEDDEYLLILNVGNIIDSGGNVAFQSQGTSELSANLYPVPTRGDLTVEVFTSNDNATQFFVRNTNGKTMILQDLVAQRGQQVVHITTENWANGVYFLQLFNGKKMQTYRFIKM